MHESEASVPTLLHIDSSIQGERSVSRALTARAARAWREAHPEGAVTYRDLGADPLPPLDAAGGLARLVPPEQHTPAQAASWALTRVLVDEVVEADTVLLGLPLYNYGPPSTVKSWVDHLVAPGLTLDPERRGPARGARPDRAGGAGRRLRRGRAARGLGPRAAVAAARAGVDGPRAALHHRGADAGEQRAGDGGAAAAGGREPRGGAGDRRAVERKARVA